MDKGIEQSGGRELEVLQEETIKAVERLRDDRYLVSGHVDIGHSLEPAARHGVYSHRLPHPHEIMGGRFRDIRNWVVGCMDARQAKGLDERFTRGRETMRFYLAGGAIQGGADPNSRGQRRRDFRTVLEYAGTISGPSEIILTAHTRDPIVATSGVCGGVRHFLGGREPADLVNDTHFNLAAYEQLLPLGIKWQLDEETFKRYLLEFAVTAAAIPSFAYLLPRHLQGVRRKAYVVIPDEANRQVHMVKVPATAGCFQSPQKLEDLTR